MLRADSSATFPVHLLSIPVMNCDCVSCLTFSSCWAGINHAGQRLRPLTFLLRGENKNSLAVIVPIWSPSLSHRSHVPWKNTHAPVVRFISSLSKQIRHVCFSRPAGDVPVWAAPPRRRRFFIIWPGKKNHF